MGIFYDAYCIWVSAVTSPIMAECASTCSMVIHEVVVVTSTVERDIANAV